ncbi:MAG: 3-dehydroquinate synthase [Chitinophagaceae bacterium]|nr:3-dehydroquinate synthase [Chitinophagaceae bacterium]
MRFSVSFPGGDTEYYLQSGYSQLLQLAPVAHSIIVTDTNVHRLYGHLFSEYRILIIEAGEKHKTWETIQLLAEKLAAFEAHKRTRLVGIGGGMVTDITGFLASVYMRGIACSFVPTSLLAMVDAAIGGKNGINIGPYKNMLGNIRQPGFILYDLSFLESLQEKEWSNGFAEVIKYACIGDAGLLEELSASTLTAYKIRPEKLNGLIHRCVQQKNTIVLADEQENGIRKLLNFGHTTGHAFETLYHLQHGQAVAFGMIVALIASEAILGVSRELRPQLVSILEQYGLQSRLRIDVEKVIDAVKRDKKRKEGTIDFILLQEAGKAIVEPVTFDQVRSALQIFADEYRP